MSRRRGRGRSQSSRPRMDLREAAAREYPELRDRTSKAVPPSAGLATVTYSPQQVAAMLAAQQRLSGGNMQAAPLPSSPYWETSPFGPGRRLPPAPINVTRDDSKRAEPRLWEYPVSWNLQINDRWHVPWETLRKAADTPLFRKCIERRKSVCQLDFAVTVDPVAVAREVQSSGAAKTDVEAGLRRQYIGDIARVTDWLTVPDRKNDMDWSAWASLLMENRLKYDAAVVYPRKTYGGDLFALEIIDGRTIKPLLDEYGGRPLPPLPAFQQILYGFPRGEWMATVDPDGEVDPQTGKPLVPGGFPGDTLYYEKSIYRSESPYGMSPTEIALMDGLVWMRRMGWIMAEYTHGVIPRGLLEVGPDVNWTPQQWEDWQRALSDHLRGVTEARQDWPMLPPGMTLMQPAQMAEQYKPDYDLFLIKLVCGDFGIPASEVGFTEAGALGASFHEGEEDILNRSVRLPDMKWLGNYATKLMRRELKMPAALRVEILGLESEDEAAADAVAQSQVASGRMTLNEDRARRGLPAFTFEEADMAMLQASRGVVFLDGSSKLGAPGTLIGPPQAAPSGPAQPGQGDGQEPEEDDEEGSGDGEQGPPSPASKTAELAALKKWLGKHASPSRPFECSALTKADAPQFAADPRVVFKDGGHPKALALSLTGRAGSGTFS